VTETVEAAEAIIFPDGFLWGAATASYQIEGAATEDGRGPSIWDTFSHTPGKVLAGDTGDVACDHYHRVDEDVQLMADLGLGGYRFSIAWPRVLPAGGGELNPAGVDFYSRLVDRLLDRGITPFATLYHWDLPQPLEDAGGWPVRDTADRFVDYALAIHERLRDRVAHWTTFNEPWCTAMLGYASGAHAPGRTEGVAGLAAAHHLMLAHGRAVAAMRAVDPTLSYGITLNLYAIDPATDADADRDAARRVDLLQNRQFLDPLLAGRYPADLEGDLAAAGLALPDDLRRDGDLEAIAVPLDFVGVNYYTRHVARAGGDRPRDAGPTWAVGSGDVDLVLRDGYPRTAMGWEVDPDGLHEVLTRVARDYGAPAVYVTENGAAYDDVVAPDGEVADPARVDFLDGHFRAARRAIDDGVDLRGYFVWSLLDNFEWAYGYSKRFGIVHVDYDTLVRTPKASARWYAQVTRRNGLVPG
jgi:beta-glucosidase